MALSLHGLRALKAQSKNLLNMKLTVKYLNFVFHIQVKTKSKNRILIFVFQFIRNGKWRFGYTDFHVENKTCQRTIKSNYEKN